MKKVVSLLLVCLLACGLLVGCVSASAEEVDTAAVASDGVSTAVTVSGSLPAVASLTVPEGCVFQGYFSEENGAGERVTSVNVASYTTVYAYFTPVKETADVRFIAFGSYSYQHDKETDDEGNEYEIGYRATEEDYREMKEFGFDQVSIDIYREGSPKAWISDMHDSLAWAQQYLFKYMVSDSAVNNEDLTPDEVKSLASFYADNDLFVGFGLADEPGYGALPGLRRIADALRAAYPDKDCHINYISYGLLNSRKGLLDYYNYANTYIDNDHMATDPYPYDAGRPDYIGSNYYNELETLAEVVRKGDKAMWAYTQTVSTADDPYDRMKFNCLADACYGTTGFVQFCYDIPHDEAGVQAGIVSAALYDKLGNRTEAWYAYRDAIKDMRPFLNVVAEYRWKYGGTVYGADATYDYEAMDSTNEYFDANATNKEAYAQYGTFVTEITSSVGIVASAFDKVNGSGEGLYLLNSTDMTKDVDAEVSFRIPSAVSATLYHDDEVTVLTPDADGLYHVTVPSADAVFVAVEFYN